MAIRSAHARDDYFSAHLVVLSNEALVKYVHSKLFTVIIVNLYLEHYLFTCDHHRERHLHLEIPAKSRHLLISSLLILFSMVTLS